MDFDDAFYLRAKAKLETMEQARRDQFSYREYTKAERDGDEEYLAAYRERLHVVNRKIMDHAECMIRRGDHRQLVASRAEARDA